MKNVLASEMEAEIDSQCTIFQTSDYLWKIGTETEKQQPDISVAAERSSACGVTNRMSKQQLYRAISVIFYWVRDHTKKAHYHIFWKPGEGNLAGYFTKKHLLSHHIVMSPV